MSQTDLVLVIDLDETFVRTCGLTDPMTEAVKHEYFTHPKFLSIKPRLYILNINDVQSPRGTGEKFITWGVMRPHGRKFLIFADKYFKEIIVWSAGLPKYVENIVSKLFWGLRKPRIVFTRDHVKEVPDPQGAYMAKPLTDLPDIDLAKTLALDDRVTTFYFNPENGVALPAYTREEISKSGEKVPREFYPEELFEDDPTFDEFQSWLETPEVRNCTDVRKLDKTHIFSHEIDLTR